MSASVLADRPEVRCSARVRNSSLIVFAIGLGLVAAATAEPQTGPVIEQFGPVFAVEGMQAPVATDRDLAVVFDVTRGSEGELNRSIESAARYLNMHARAGVDPARMKVAIVVHSGASFDLLTDSAAQSRFGRANPNTPLLDALAKADVAIYLCGQSAAWHGIKADELHGAVSLALSAMTMFEALQSEGYRLIP